MTISNEAAKAVVILFWIGFMLFACYVQHKSGRKKGGGTVQP